MNIQEIINKVNTEIINLVKRYFPEENIITQYNDTEKCNEVTLRDKIVRYSNTLVKDLTEYHSSTAEEIANIIMFTTLDDLLKVAPIEDY